MITFKMEIVRIIDFLAYIEDYKQTIFLIISDKSLKSAIYSKRISKISKEFYHEVLDKNIKII